MLGEGPRLTVLQHVPHEPPGRVATWALEQGIVVERVRLWMDDAVPEVEDVQALVLLGGPASVRDTDEHPWLADEIDLVRRAAEAGVPVLGICLGAQVIARALGGSVEPMDEPEVGVFEVEATEAAAGHPLTRAWPDRFPALHWHGERFEPPDQATPLASSDACKQQAFAVGEHVLGLQFHLEYSATDVTPLARETGFDLGSGPTVQTADEMREDPVVFVEAQDVLDATLEPWMAHA